MGFDISYHPIGIDQMNAWYFHRLPEVEREDFSQLQKLGKDIGMDDSHIDKYIETMKVAVTTRPENLFEKHHAYYMAVAQGFFLPYFYTRGTSFSLLLQQAPELKEYTTSWNNIKPENILCPVTDSLVENYSGGIYIGADQVVALLAELEREGKTKEVVSAFFEGNFPVFIKALKYAKQQDMGLLEASEVVEPNPLDLNRSVSYANLFNCDPTGVVLYQRVAMKQINEAIHAHKRK